MNRPLREGDNMSCGACRCKAGTRVGHLLLGIGMVLVFTAGLAASPVAESVPEVSVKEPDVGASEILA